MSERGRGRASAGIPEVDEEPTTAMTIDARLERIERRLIEIESRSLRRRGRTLMDRFVPPEASGHFRNAGREQLLGVRAIVDHWIRRIDEADRRSAGAEVDAPPESIPID